MKGVPYVANKETVFAYLFCKGYMNRLEKFCFPCEDPVYSVLRFKVTPEIKLQQCFCNCLMYFPVSFYCCEPSISNGFIWQKKVNIVVRLGLRSLSCTLNGETTYLRKSSTAILTQRNNEACLCSDLMYLTSLAITSEHI